jgi:hypothetical protein
MFFFTVFMAMFTDIVTILPRFINILTVHVFNGFVGILIIFFNSYWNKKAGNI